VPNKDCYVLRNSPFLHRPLYFSSARRSASQTMADLYPPNYYHMNQDNSSDEPPSPAKSNPDTQQHKPDAKPQATFLTKLYAYVFAIRGTTPTDTAQSPRETREPAYDSLGPRRRAHYRRAARATRPPCPSVNIPPVPLRFLLPPAKCGSPAIFANTQT
jgi:hypothetical protein